VGEGDIATDGAIDGIHVGIGVGTMLVVGAAVYVISVENGDAAAKRITTLARKLVESCAENELSSSDIFASSAQAARVGWDTALNDEVAWKLTDHWKLATVESSSAPLVEDFVTLAAMLLMLVKSKPS
jgi:hypothetical protein